MRLQRLITGTSPPVNNVKFSGLRSPGNFQINFSWKRSRRRFCLEAFRNGPMLKELRMEILDGLIRQEMV